MVVIPPFLFNIFDIILLLKISLLLSLTSWHHPLRLFLHFLWKPPSSNLQLVSLLDRAVKHWVRYLKSNIFKIQLFSSLYPILTYCLSIPLLYVHFLKSKYMKPNLVLYSVNTLCVIVLKYFLVTTQFKKILNIRLLKIPLSFSFVFNISHNVLLIYWLKK